MERNIRGAFRGASLSPLNPAKVLDKLLERVITTVPSTSTEVSLAGQSSEVIETQTPLEYQYSNTPKSSERINSHLKKILEDLDTIEFEMDSTTHDLPLSPIRKKVKHLASSALTAMAGQAIQKQSNAQLRACIKSRKLNKLLKTTELGD
jgi:hypothetical protein